MIKTENFIIMAEHYESDKAKIGYAAGDMDNWWGLDTVEMDVGDSMTAGDLFGTCGSTACLRGLAICLFKPERSITAQFVGNNGQLSFMCPHNAALDGEILLGLEQRESCLLFDATRWSPWWRGELKDAPNATMARICRMIAKHGQVDFLAASGEPR